MHLFTSIRRLLIDSTQKSAIFSDVSPFRFPSFSNFTLVPVVVKYCTTKGNILSSIRTDSIECGASALETIAFDLVAAAEYFFSVVESSKIFGKSLLKQFADAKD